MKLSDYCGLRSIVVATISLTLLTMACSTLEPAAEDQDQQCAADSEYPLGLGSGFWIGHFRGIVVRRNLRGEYKAIRGAQFFDLGGQLGVPEKPAFTAGYRGTFNHRTYVGYSVWQYCFYGHLHEEEMVGWRTYLVRAAGCTDQEVRYQPGDRPQMIVLQCEER